MEVNLENIELAEPAAASVSDEKKDANIKFENPNKTIDKKSLKMGK